MTDEACVWLGTSCMANIKLKVSQAMQAQK